MQTIFISYSRKDIDFVRKLARDLEKADYDIWWDFADLRGGEDWVRRIPEVISTSQHVLVVLTPNSIESEWVRKEYTQALSLRKKIIPLVQTPCTVPFALNTINYIDFTLGDYAESYNRLLEALEYSGEPPSVTPIELESRSLPPTPRKFILFVILGIFLLAFAIWAAKRPPDMAPTDTPKLLPSPTATHTPEPSTPTPVPCDTDVTVDDIPHIAPALAGGTPFGVAAEIICKNKRPDREYSVGLSFHSGSAFQWGISSPGVMDLSQYGSVSFWLKGNQGGEEMILGITDAEDYFAKHAISASSEWTNVIIPLSEFQDKGVDLHQVQNIFMDFEGSGEATVYVDEVAFAPKLNWEFRGVNLTAFSQDGYQSSQAKALVDHFKQMGANCVAVLVTWYQDGQDTTAIAQDLNKTPSEDSLTEIIDYIHDQDMKVLLNLHVDDRNLNLDYPAVDRWRGNFSPADPAQWFNSYRDFVITYAQLAEATQVEIINIGSEQVSLEAAEEDVSRWIDLIRAVREEGYTGRLMYTMGRRSVADQQREDKLALLWKELDYVGTTVHFTLSEEAAPSTESLVQAWKQHAVTLNDWANTIQKPIIFTEVAYPSVEYCSKEPWRWRGTPGQQGGNGEKCQQNAYEALLQTFGSESWLVGAFWWNYFPGSPSEYSPENKLADNMVHRWYGGLRTETLLQSPIPPAPSEVIYELEAPTNMWIQPESSSLTTVAVTSRNRPDSDDWILEWMVSLAGGDEQRRQGEALLDLRYSRVSDSDLAGTTRPFSYELLGKSVSCWIYVPGAPVGLTIQAFGKSLRDSESNWWSEYGGPVPVKGDEWFIVTLNPDGISDNSGETDSDDVNLEFDPKHVIAIGVKLTAIEDTEYNGALFIDACSWSAY